MFGRLPLIVYNPKNIGKKESGYLGNDTKLYLDLFKEKIPFSPFFCISNYAFEHFLESAHLTKKIAEILKGYNPVISGSAQRCSQQILKELFNARLGETIKKPVMFAYHNLTKSENPTVLVKQSHFIPENIIPLRERYSVKYVNGEKALEWAIINSWASLFSTEAIELRGLNNYKKEISLGLIIQVMNIPEISGKVFTIPPATQEKNLLEIRAVYGLSDFQSYLDSNSDVYKVSKKNGEIVEKRLTEQKIMKIVTSKKSMDPSSEKTEVEISKSWRNRPKLSSEKIIEIARIGKKIESKSQGIPLEISWNISEGVISIEEISSLAFLKSEPKNKAVIKRLDLNSQKSLSIKEKITQHALKADLEKLESVPKLEFNLKDFAIKKSQGLTVKNKLARDIKTKTPILLDVSEMQTKRLEDAKRFNGVFFDINPQYNLIIDSSADQTAISKNATRILNSLSLNSKILAKLFEEKEIFLKLVTNYPKVSTNVLKNLLAIQSQGIFKGLPDNFKRSKINWIIPSCRSVDEIIEIKRQLFAFNFLKINSKTHLWSELEIPSLLMDLDQLNSKVIDGVIINFENFGKIFFYKETFTELELKKLTAIVSEVITNLKKKELKVVLRLESINSQEPLTLLKHELNKVIISQTPLEENIKLFNQMEANGN